MQVETGEYKPGSVAACEMVARKVSSNGKGPCARSLHSSQVFKNYFVVFGGRNDDIFGKNMNTVALNDLHMMDMQTNDWMTVAMFATEELPDSRWGHSLCASNDQLLLLGGMNLNTYCESVVFDIIIDDQAI
jgi:N-acetylneuraminic acid mutarotase